jgi:hypothetical protein
MRSWRRWWVASCALALVATATTAGCSERPSQDAAGAASDTQSTTPTSGPTTGPTTGPSAGEQPSVDIPTVGVGERVTAAGYELVVHEVTAPAPAPDPAAAPGPGHMLMAIDVEVINRTASQRDATYLTIEVVDANGGRYEPSPYGQALASGWIAADAPQRVRQVYEVPILATGLVLTLRPDLVSNIAAAVRLR